MARQIHQLRGKHIIVKIYWVTDADGSRVPDDVKLEDLPQTWWGPFETEAAAGKFAAWSFPDDPDIEDTIVCKINELPDHLNDPSRGLWVGAPDYEGVSV